MCRYARKRERGEVVFFFQAEDGIRDVAVTGVQTCALPISCEAGTISVRPYWTLPVRAPLHYTRPNDCVEEFRELLDRAVTDRVRTNNVGILMSGGLDSPTVAASAKRTLARNGSAGGLCAYTEAFESLIPHQDRHYAGLVVEALKIPIEFQLSDEMGLWKHLKGTNIRR